MAMQPKKMTFFGQYCRAGLDPDEEELTGDEAQAALEIIQRVIIGKFAEGQPFFTKDAIRDVRDQINRFTEKGQKITVEGLDGVAVEFVVETGRVFHYDHYNAAAEVEYIWYPLISLSHTRDKSLIRCQDKTIHLLPSSAKADFLPRISVCRPSSRLLQHDHRPSLRASRSQDWQDPKRRGYLRHSNGKW
jgi:hypothetical protein